MFQTISLSTAYGMVTVNCYLIATEAGYILIDTGTPNKRTYLEKELERAGCSTGNLKLIVLTHGDFDHTGNAAYLRAKFDSKIAMHRDDSGVVERGDILWGRKTRNPFVRMIAARLFKFGEAEKFRPDLYVREGDSLSGYGFNARVLHIPGHSKGSIGVITADGVLFCGDLFINRKNKPRLNRLIDDQLAAAASVEKLKRLNIGMVYPAHGKPFPMELLKRDSKRRISATNLEYS
jgi:hydroxyacylglutathione hydrolase